MVMNDPIGDTRTEHVRRAPMMLMAKHEQVNIELLRPLQDRPRDVVRSRAYDLAVRVYSSGRQSVDERLYRISVCVLDIIVRHAHAKAGTTRYVTRDDVPACHMKDVHSRTG